MTHVPRKRIARRCGDKSFRKPEDKIRRSGSFDRVAGFRSAGEGFPVGKGDRGSGVSFTTPGVCGRKSSSSADVEGAILVGSWDNDQDRFAKVPLTVSPTTGAFGTVVLRGIARLQLSFSPVTRYASTCSSVGLERTATNRGVEGSSPPIEKPTIVGYPTSGRRNANTTPRDHSS